jgi:monothiol glutaredoxin
MGLRQGLQESANWPRVPQLDRKAELVGGGDIARDMHESGELADFLAEKGVAAAKAPA